MLIIRKTVYLSLGILDKIIASPKPVVIILCYHNISADGWRFSVPFSEFKKQIEYLLKHRNPVSLSDLVGYLSGKSEISRPSFILVFDDGYQELLQVKDYLKNHNIKPGLLLLSKPEKANRSELDSSAALLSVSGVKSLMDSGWEIGCHGATHSDFSKITSNEVVDEVIKSKISLEVMLNSKVEYFAFPKGKYSDDICNAVRIAGYKLCLTMDDGFISKQTNPLLLPRIGVDQTHSFTEFKSIFSPSVIALRRFLKNHKLAKLYD